MNRQTIEIPMRVSITDRMNRQTIEIPMRVSITEVTVPMTVSMAAVVTPIPSNYGLITYNGGIITVS